MRFHPARTVAVAAMAITGAFLAAGPASAHVSANPSTAEQGGFTKIDFRVPTESDTASTVKLTVSIPQDTPIPFVTPQSKPGWKVEVTKKALATPITMEGDTVTEAVTEVTWSGGAIPPGQFDEFALSIGPMPTVESLAFPAVQTYDDGDVVRWVDPVVEGQAEPEHPVPTVTLAAAGADGGSDHHGGETTTTSATGVTAAPEKASSATTSSSGSGAPAGVTWAALALGAVGAVAGLGSLARRKGS